MNNQFATQFLREDAEEFSAYLDSADQLVAKLRPTIEKGLAAGMSKEEILDIIDQILRLNEDGAAAAGGGSPTGGGVTNGASFTPGAGEQYAATKAFKGTRKKKYQEDAPRLAGSPAKTTKQGAKNLSAYSSVGFTKAPSAEEAGKKMKSIDVKMLWKEGEQEIEVRWSDIEDHTKKLGRKLHGFKPDSSEEFYFLDYMKDAFKEGLITNPQSLLTTASNYSEVVTESEVGFESGDKVRILPGSGWIRPGANITGTIHDIDGEGAYSVLIDAPGKPLKTIKARYLEPLSESRAYSRFKKETSVRSESERMHEAVKMIHKKLEEVSRLLEFTSQMKKELSEANDTLEYKQNTRKVFEKINKKVVEVYSKSKKLG